MPRTILRALLAVAMPVALVVCTGSALAAKGAAKSKAPLLKSLTYTALTSHGSDGYLQAHFTATVKLYQSAPSITFTIDSTSSHNIETEAGPEKSYSAGTHKVSFVTDALPGGTFKITLVAYVAPPKGSTSYATTINSSDPATLVVEEAPEGQDGKGKVTKV